MLSAGTRWTLVVAACVLCSSLCMSASAQESLSPTIFHRLYEAVAGKQMALKLDIPECLIELKGGVSVVEDVLKEGTQDGKRWAILVTSSGDKSSVAAIEKFYKTVAMACTPPSSRIIATDGSIETGAETQTPLGNFEDDDATSDQGYTDDVANMDFSEWKFAYMSFMEEPDLIWRWWIWKVPSIVFVSTPTQDQLPFDMRFWKVAFSMPPSEAILEIIGTGGWMNLPVWQSSLAPGGSLELIPHGLAKGFSVFYSILDPVPTWLLTIIASVLGSSLISTMHGGGGTT